MHASLKIHEKHRNKMLVSLLNHGIYLYSSFISVTVMKYPNKSNLQKRGLTWCTIPGYIHYDGEVKAGTKSITSKHEPRANERILAYFQYSYTVQGPSSETCHLHSVWVFLLQIIPGQSPTDLFTDQPDLHNSPTNSHLR